MGAARTASSATTGRGGRDWTRLLPAIIIGLVVLMGAASTFEALFERTEAARSADYESDMASVRLLQAVVAEAAISTRDYVLAGKPGDLAPYQIATVALAGDGRPSARLDRYAAAQGDAGGSRTPATEALATLRAAWDAAVKLAGDGQQSQAIATLTSPPAQDASARLRGYITGYLGHRATDESGWEARADAKHALIRALNLGGALLAIAAMVYAFGRITRAITAGSAARDQVEQLFAMADMLQSAAGQEDTNLVLRTTAMNLLPGLGGALYVFNNSRDRLDLSTRWGPLAEGSADHLAPAECWALKRGKPHLNGASEGALRCDHATQGQMTLEIPMAARGQLYGLLQIIADGPHSAARLADARPVAGAVGDAMSLALSSIALRERLRNQALRDPLTGLYNRRFLEEMLERICAEAERRQGSVSAIMLDLDHFKKLNDQHGHGAGDAALRDVAAAVLSCLRAVDIACRYGGEEIAILLPDCPAAMAAGKAEQIRSRIAGLTGAAGVSVTASLGVASIPETSARAQELLTAADAALYQAKQQGRDRVVLAPARAAVQQAALIEPEPVRSPAVLT